MSFKESIRQVLSKRSSAPFLFIGSGFSRRYINLEDWDGLLSRFCVMGKPYAYYNGSANQQTQVAARLIAEDFHEYWWNEEKYLDKRNKYSNNIVDKTSPLRFEICDYLNEISSSHAGIECYKNEIDLLSTCDVDGIITTNWDMFLEKLFPNYKVFVGQKELLFSNPLSVGEIYKIHGCSSKPESLILTDVDYSDYNERNAYLAAKLIIVKCGTVYTQGERTFH